MSEVKYEVTIQLTDSEEGENLDMRIKQHHQNLPSEKLSELLIFASKEVLNPDNLVKKTIQ